MSASGTMTVIDEYLDALLDDTPSPAAGAIAWPDDADVAAAVPLPASPPPAEIVAAADTPSSTVADPGPPPALAHLPQAAAPAPQVVMAPPAFSPPPPTPAAPSPYTPPASATAPIAIVQTHRWLRVAVGGDSYALELMRVQEVVRLTPIVTMRGATRAVLGVMNLRGRIVPVFDLGLWLDAGCVHPDERSRIVVVERGDELIGVLVSAVEDVVTLGRDRIEPPLTGSDPGAIVGIARVGPSPTVLLDANTLFG